MQYIFPNESKWYVRNDAIVICGVVGDHSKVLRIMRFAYTMVRVKPIIYTMTTEYSQPNIWPQYIKGWFTYSYIQPNVWPQMVERTIPTGLVSYFSVYHTEKNTYGIHRVALTTLDLRDILHGTKRGCSALIPWAWQKTGLKQQRQQNIFWLVGSHLKFQCPTPALKSLNMWDKRCKSQTKWNDHELYSSSSQSQHWDPRHLLLLVGALPGRQRSPVSGQKYISQLVGLIIPEWST